MKKISVCVFLSACIANIGQAEESDLFNLSLHDLAQTKVSVASFHPETLTQAPASVSLITSDQWQQQSARTVAEAVSSLPGVWITPSNYGGQAVNMRGFFPSYHGVSTLLDGVTVNSFLDSSAFEGYRHWQLATLSQIEVIRGPGSSQYGADALRGVIAMNSWGKIENKMPYANAQLSYADSGARDYQLRNEIPLGVGALRFAGEAQFQPDQNQPYRYSEPATGETKHSQYANEFNNHMALLGWSAQLAENKLEIALYNARDFAERAAGIGTSLAAGQSVNEDRDFSGADQHFSMARTRLSHAFSNQADGECTLSVWQKAGYSELDRTRDPLALTTSKFQSKEGKNFFQCFSHVRAQGGSDATIGVEYSRQYMDRLRQSDYFADGHFAEELIFPEEGFARITSSAFFQSKTNIKNTTLSLGGRYDHFSDFAAHFSPRLAIIQEVNKTNFIKLIAGNSLLSPTPFQLFGNDREVIAAPKLKAEEIDSYELNWSHLSNNQLFSVTGFYNHWFDGIVLQRVENASGPFRVQYQNADRSHSQGIELEWQREWRSLNMQLSFTHSEGKNETSGLAYSGFPQNILNMQLSHPLNNKIRLGMNAVAANHYDVRYAVETDPAPPSAPTYLRLDLHASYRPDKQLEVFSDVRNLTNRRNILTGVYNQETGLYDEDALVKLGINWRWY